MVYNNVKYDLCLTKFAKKESNCVGHWGIEMFGIENLHKTKLSKGQLLRGGGIKVAILDSGICAHDWLKVETSHLMDCVKNKEGEAHDDTGHGTFVAGIIAASTEHGCVSIAPDVELYIGKVTENNCTDLKALIAGINWAIDKKVNIINLSIESENHSHELFKAIRRAIQANISVICAAGNSGERRLIYPARHEETISVGTLQRKYAKRSNKVIGVEYAFSNFGISMDFLAPGNEVVSLGTENNTKSGKGSSYATAYMSGLTALIIQAFEDKYNIYPNYKQVKGILISSCTNLLKPGHDIYTGYGYVSPETAIRKTLN